MSTGLIILAALGGLGVIYVRFVPAGTQPLTARGDVSDSVRRFTPQPHGATIPALILW